jgi:hypothetical protein
MISSGSLRCLTPRTGGDDLPAVPPRPPTEPRAVGSVGGKTLIVTLGLHKATAGLS